MEHRLGGDFSNVRIIRGPLAEEITARYRADAVTVGGTELILVREGWQSNFQSAEGAALLAHELTHVRQNQRGLHFEHSGGADDASSEHEIEAYRVQAQVKAEEQGRRTKQQLAEHFQKMERKVWTEVKRRAKEKIKRMKGLAEIRGGSHNLQGQSK